MFLLEYSAKSTGNVSYASPAEIKGLHGRNCADRLCGQRQPCFCVHVSSPLTGRQGELILKTKGGMGKGNCAALLHSCIVSSPQQSWEKSACSSRVWGGELGE